MGLDLETTLDDRMLDMCQTMKAEGIIIYAQGHSVARPNAGHVDLTSKRGPFRQRTPSSSLAL